jgi:hypothetical protein
MEYKRQMTTPIDDLIKDARSLVGRKGEMSVELWNDKAQCLLAPIADALDAATRGPSCDGLLECLNEMDAHNKAREEHDDIYSEGRVAFKRGVMYAIMGVRSWLKQKQEGV